MRTGCRYRWCWFSAFGAPFSRLRHVFAMSSDCLRGRCCKALGLINLCSDYPLDSGHCRRWHLDSVGGTNATSRSRSRALPNVVRAKDALELVVDIALAGRAPDQDPAGRHGLEHTGDQLKTNITLMVAHTTNHAVCLRKNGLTLKHAMRPDQSGLILNTGNTCQKTRKEMDYVAKSWGNTI